MQENAWTGPPPRPGFLGAIRDAAVEFFTPPVLVLTLLILIVCFVLWAATDPVHVEHHDNKSKEARAREDLRLIADQVWLFYTDQRRYPAAWSEMVKKPKRAKDWPDGGYLDGIPHDPWGAEYVLTVPGHNGSSCDVISLGADNQPGGDGIDADLVIPVGRR